MFLTACCAVLHYYKSRMFNNYTSRVSLFVSAFPHETRMINTVQLLNREKKIFHQILSIFSPRVKYLLSYVILFQYVMKKFSGIKLIIFKTFLSRELQTEISPEFMVKVCNKLIIQAMKNEQVLNPSKGVSSLRPP